MIGGPATRLTEDPLRLSDMIREATRRSDGAVAAFVGVVREENGGEPVETIEYSAYRPMAERELEKIEEEISRTFPGTSVRVRHRLGTLSVGEESVAVVAVSPHRREALAACAEAIERIKARAPIWKKELDPGGTAVWVEPERVISSGKGDRQ